MSYTYFVAFNLKIEDEARGFGNTFITCDVKISKIEHIRVIENAIEEHYYQKAPLTHLPMSVFISNFVLTESSSDTEVTIKLSK